MRRDEDAELRRFLAAVGAIVGVHAQRVHVLKVCLPSGAWLTSTTPGTPDVFCIVAGNVVWLEFKTTRGKDEDSQIVWHRAYRAAGGTVWRCTCAVETVRQLAALASGNTRAALTAAAETMTAALAAGEGR